jgi:3-oxoadipate enol-lactonase
VGPDWAAPSSLRVALAFPARVRTVVVVSAEDIEDDDAKLAETALMDRFAERVRTEGIEAAWELFLPHLQPLIGNLVRSAIPRANPGSVAAAAAIGRARSFRTLDELGVIEVPVLIVPGADERHPAAFAERMSATIPYATLARTVSFDALRTASPPPSSRESAASSTSEARPCPRTWTLSAPASRIVVRVVAKWEHG